MAGIPLFHSSLSTDAALVSYWKFDGNSNDSKGSNNGTDSNVNYAAGKFVSAAGYAAASSSGTSIATMALNYTDTSAFSWGIWVNPSNTTTGYIMTSNVSPGAGNFSVSIIKDAPTGGRVEFIALKGGVGTTNIESSVPYVTGAWEFYVITYDGSTNMVLYRNGVSVATGTYSHGAAGSSGSGMYFGFANNATNYITGSLDDAFVYSRVLTANEVFALYNAGRIHK